MPGVKRDGVKNPTVFQGGGKWGLERGGGWEGRYTEEINRDDRGIREGSSRWKTVSSVCIQGGGLEGIMALLDPVPYCRDYRHSCISICRFLSLADSHEITSQPRAVGR